MADTVFNFIMAEAVKEARGKQRAAGLLPAIVWDGKRLPSLGETEGVATPFARDDSFADDYVGFITATKAQGCLAKVKASMAIVDDVFTTKGMKLNYKEGKTSVLLRLYGPGAPEAKRHVFTHDKHELRFEGITRGKLVVKVVHSYKHVGSEVTDNTANVKEAHCRKNASTAALRPLRKPLFTNEVFARDARLQLLDPLVHSKLFFQTAAWTNWKDTDYEQL